MKFLTLLCLIVGGLIPTTSFVFGGTLDPLYGEVPASITVVDNETFTGLTTNGYVYSQSRIVSDAAIRIHKFVIADRHFYISDRGYIEAADDLSAISIYLSLGEGVIT